MRVVVAILICSMTCLAQPLTVGVKVVIRVTSEPDLYGPSESRPYLVGPTVELRLPHDFAIEADALYSRLGNTVTIPLIGMESWIRTRANAWEFPLLAKYRLPLRHIRPYALLGFAPRHANGRVDTTGYMFVTINTFSTYHDVSYWRASDHAWVAGGGLDWGTRHIRVAPEVRYLRHKVPSTPVEGDLAYYLAVPTNEVQVKVGFGWKF